jgi:mRNA-degrading endonuclease RelE of RelBE toxin-antitoxin system
LGAGAIRDLRALDKTAARRVVAKLKTLAAADDATVPRLRHLGPEAGDVYKLRVGDYRVLFRLVGTDILVDVIAHRSEVYQLLRRRPIS